MSYVQLGDLIRREPELKLQVHAGSGGLTRHLITIDVNRPGLALAGYYENFASDRIQIFGRGECAYLVDSDHRAAEIRRDFFRYKFPGLVFTHGSQPPDDFLEAAEETDSPLLTTSLSTHNFIVLFSAIMTQELAPTTSIHGVLVEVLGVGILLMGASGIGKSETALELVERGHRLVADDIVIIKCIGNTALVGAASEIISHHMELRGLGIINVKDLFGVGAIRGSTGIDLVIGLEDWDEGKEYERLGLDEELVEILGVKIPRLLLPVRPGRNIPILIETAAMNYRSRQMGYHAARDLSKKITLRMQQQRDGAAEDGQP